MDFFRQRLQPPTAPDHPVNVLLVLLAAVLVCGLVARLLGEAIAMSMGSSLEALLAPDKTSWNPTERLGLRALNLLVHLATFTLSAWLTGRLFYRPHTPAYFGLDKPPAPLSVGHTALFMLAALPMAQVAYWLNRHAPLPSWMRGAEKAQNEMVEAMLQMDNAGELVIALLVLAVVPALGEELLFRGVVQQQLGRWLRRPTLSIWITAFLFSLVHWQFEGFLPRFLLGAALGYLFVWSRNLWLPIIGHFCFNGIQVLGKWWMGDEIAILDEQQLTPPNLWLSLGAALLMAAAGAQLRKSNPSP
jgi:hypothetical protein